MTATTISEYIVTKCVNDGCPVSNLQLQKFLFYIQKAYLARGMSAFPDGIEAWQFGPVVPSVYYKFCGYGAMPITAMFNAILPAEDKTVIDSIVEEKRVLNPWDLVRETHNPTGAWAKVYDEGRGNRNLIELDLIRSMG